MYKRYYIKRRL